MKLELKHLAPYLPYGINFMCIDTYSREYEILSIVSIDLAKEEMQIGASDYNFSDIGGKECKMVLRPLSDITKRIDNDEDNVTYAVFLNVDRDLDLEIHSYDNDWVYVNIIEMHEKLEKLFEWHFDVFGLIEKGLAIDLNTLSNPPLTGSIKHKL